MKFLPSNNFSKFFKFFPITTEVSAIARRLGHVKPLSREQIQKLLELRERLGLKGRVYPCNNCGLCDRGEGDAGDDVVRTISAEVVKTIRERMGHG